MFERIVGLVCCILCAFPLFIIGYYYKNSREPIGFWAGDKSLKEKVKDVPGYNGEMTKLFLSCAFALIAAGVLCLFYVNAGICAILLECSAGIYVAWKRYKKI